MSSESVQCTACEHRGAKPDPFFYEWKSRVYEIYRCGACTHQFVHPPVGAEDQSEIYGDHYFSKDGDWVCGIFQADYTSATEQLRAEANQVLGFLPVRTGRLLDVGCAGGVFLDEARRAGFEVAGVELNSTQAANAREQFGLDVANARIEDIAIDRWREPFDVVTILDCLEHLPQPLSAVRKMAAWTRSGGHLLVRGPLANSLIGRAKETARRVVGVRKLLPGYPLDANMFNRRSMTRMLDLAGFKVIDWIGTTTNFSNILARRA